MGGLSKWDTSQQETELRIWYNTSMAKQHITTYHKFKINYMKVRFKNVRLQLYSIEQELT